MISEVPTSSMTLWRILPNPGNVFYVLLGIGVESNKWNPLTGVDIKM